MVQTISLENKIFQGFEKKKEHRITNSFSILKMKLDKTKNANTNC